jgi:hypothetical protein
MSPTGEDVQPFRPRNASRYSLLCMASHEVVAGSLMVEHGFEAIGRLYMPLMGGPP